jgi:hypothetical protein
LIIFFVIFFSIKKHLVDFFKKTNKLKYKGFEAEIASQQQDSIELPSPKPIKVAKSNPLIEKHLLQYSDFTIEKAKNIVNEESKF